MPNLDGTDVIKPVPFDAHEQAVRGTHVETTPESPDKDPATVAEFPKAVDHVDHPSGVGLQPVIANSPEEEADYKAAKAEVAAPEAPKPAEDPKPAA